MINTLVKHQYADGLEYPFDLDVHYFDGVADICEGFYKFASGQWNTLTFEMEEFELEDRNYEYDKISKLGFMRSSIEKWKIKLRKPKSGWRW